jgi:hypothetical protein
MQHLAAKTGRVLLGILSLFAAWALGGYVGDLLCPESSIVGGRESLAAKTGSSVAIVIASLVLGRYILRSFRLALLCLGSTELLVLLIIMGFSGLGMLALSDIRFNVWWLYAVTWNVVLAFLLGAGLGVLWFRRAANNVPEATAG